MHALTFVVQLKTDNLLFHMPFRFFSKIFQMQKIVKKIAAVNCYVSAVFVMSSVNICELIVSSDSSHSHRHNLTLQNEVVFVLVVVVVVVLLKCSDRFFSTALIPIPV